MADYSYWIKLFLHCLICAYKICDYVSVYVSMSVSLSHNN